MKAPENEKGMFGHAHTMLANPSTVTAFGDVKGPVGADYGGRKVYMDKLNKKDYYNLMNKFAEKYQELHTTVANPSDRTEEAERCLKRVNNMIVGKRLSADEVFSLMVYDLKFDENDAKNYVRCLRSVDDCKLIDHKTYLKMASVEGTKQSIIKANEEKSIDSRYSVLATKLSKLNKFKVKRFWRYFETRRWKRVVKACENVAALEHKENVTAQEVKSRIDSFNEAVTEFRRLYTPRREIRDVLDSFEKLTPLTMYKVTAAIENRENAHNNSIVDNNISNSDILFKGNLDEINIGEINTYEINTDKLKRSDSISSSKKSFRTYSKNHDDIPGMSERSHA